MSNTRSFDVAVLGGGPSGLVAALAASEIGRTVLVTDRVPMAEDAVRIDCVPARALALLAELGVTPRSLGVSHLGTGRWTSWASSSPEYQSDAPMAHIERPLLELALFAAVCTKAVTVIVDRSRPLCGDVLEGPGWRATCLIDATGRAAVTATERKSAASPWASHFYWNHRRDIRADPDFRIVPLHNGYVYRLGSADKIGIGVVGESKLVKSSASELERLLREEGAGWVLHGMPPLHSLRRGARGIATVQWTIGSRAMLVGDAALAHDSLSSQGIGVSLSDALYAVSAINTCQTDALCARHIANRNVHLTHLKTSLDRCRFREHHVWKRYRDFVASNVSAQPKHADPPNLVNGQLVR